MKKIFLMIPLSFITLTSYANNFICPFTDYFSISAPSGYTITSLSPDGNVLTAQQGPLDFTTFCKDPSSIASGKIFVTLSTSDCDLCTLHIIDGPYEMNPTVSYVTCVGHLKFNGMEHVWGTYSYKLRFSH